MQAIIFFFLNQFRRVRHLYLKLTGKTEADLIAQRVVSGKAWTDFCDNLKAAGAALAYPGTPRDAFQQAEGLRYLSRLTRAGLEAYVEYSDPTFPVFRRMVHETVKLGADNPDNHYLNAQINGNFEYKITGKRNTIHYVGFFTQNGNYGTTGGLSPCGVLEHFDLKTDDQGNFEIILSKDRKGPNWLKIEDETSLLLVRQTYLDHQNEVPIEVNIENLNGKRVPDPITPAQIDEGLRTAALFVAGAPFLFAKWARGFQKHTNRLPVFDPEVSNAAGGDANITYHHSHWKLGPDEALVIEVKPPICDTWNFQLNNYWMESLDYRYFPISVNRYSAVTEKDGSVRVFVSHQDPGPVTPNWLSTCGHTEGTMCWRWYRLAEGASPVEPECKVVKISEIITAIA
jgi:hypothetical protein